MSVRFLPLVPWTHAIRGHVLDICEHMASRDREEIFGLRPGDRVPEGIVADIAMLIVDRRLLDGFVAFHDLHHVTRAVAVALAFRSTMPKTAELALFGRSGSARAIPAVYAELERRAADFGRRHGVVLAQVPVLATHRAARRKLAATGGIEAFHYGPIGPDGQDYVHTLWRFA